MLKIEVTRDRIFLALTMALAGFLSFYAVWNEGFGNTYYAAAVKSMLTSFSNFFFVSYDPGGFVSVDKPPLGLWIQALSAVIFGFHGWSLILPQALATVISTAIIYHLVRRTFGNPAGLLSALMFALTPVVAAVSRTNNLDPLLVMLLLLAAWALIVAAERGSLKLLLLSMALVGLGFNVKMLQAFGVLPAFFLAYWLSPALNAGTKIKHLSIAVVLLLVVALSWTVLVDMTPADQRPYVGSSQTNSVLELSLGYNGLQRIVPGGSPMGAIAHGTGDDSARNLPGSDMPPGALPAFTGSANAPGGMSDTSGPSMPAGMMGPGGEGGSAGILRLFNQEMAGQISWLLPLAILGFLASFLIIRRNRDETEKAKLRSLYLWGLWMLPMLAYFSIAGFFHRYYLITLAPPIAALSGIGLARMWDEYRAGGRYSYMLPLALVVNAIVEALILLRYPGISVWIVPVICAVSFTAAIVLVYAKYESSGAFKNILKPLLVCACAALLIAPAFWSITPIIYHSEVTLPYAGPELSAGIFTARASTGMPDLGAGTPGPMGSMNVPAGLEQFLIDNAGNERFLVAVPNAMAASGIILDTGRPVMAIGGFLGSDPILTVDRLKSMVASGELRYFLTMEMGGFFNRTAPSDGDSTGADLTGNMTASVGMPGMMGGSQAEINSWVKAHGTLVPASEWMDENATGTISGGSFDRGITPYQLYDLKDVR